MNNKISTSILLTQNMKWDLTHYIELSTSENVKLEKLGKPNVYMYLYVYYTSLLYMYRF